MEIRVRYSSIDGYRVTRKYKTLAGAQAFARTWVGETPEIGSTYAVSGDGIGKITVEGIDIRQVFPEPCVEEVDAPAIEKWFRGL